MNKKKFAVVAKFFCGHAYSTDLVRVFVERVDREEKRHADCTNRHILEHINREKKTKQNCEFLANLPISKQWPDDNALSVRLHFQTFLVSKNLW